MSPPPQGIVGRESKESYLWSACAQGLLIRLLLVVVNVFCALCLNGQRVDSLAQVWNDEAADRGERADAVVQLLWHYIGADPDTARMIAQEFLALSVKNKNGSDILRARHMLAIAHATGGNRSEGRSIWEKNIEECKNDTSEDARRWTAQALGGIGLSYAEDGLYRLAIGPLYAALQHAEHTGDSTALGKVLMNLGVVHSGLDERGLALKSHQRAAMIFSRIGHRTGEAIALNNAANSLTALGDFKQGDSLYLRSEYIARGLGNQNLIGTIHSSLAASAMQQGRLDMALSYFISANRILEMVKDSIMLAHSLLGQGETYLLLRKYRAAGQACKSAELIARSNKNLADQRGACMCLSRAYEKLRMPEPALRYLREYTVLTDTMNVGENIRLLTTTDLEHKHKKKQEADSLLYVLQLANVESEKLAIQYRAEQARQRIVLYSAIVAVLLAISAFVLWLDRQRRRARFERESTFLQMKALRTQMNPHFIFNALNSINNYVQENERDLASGFLTKFARLMRLVLENSRHDEVPLAQDLEALRLYMDLEQARMNNRFRYEVDIDPTIDQDYTMVPPLVLQPFVENAIWHGLSRKEGSGLLRLSVKQRDGALIMTVEDDGVGRNAADGPNDPMAPPKTSMGTGITQERLAMLGKQRGGEAGFRYLDTVLGTRVEVSLPAVAAGSR